MKNGLEFVQLHDTIKVESLMNAVFCMAHFFISRADQQIIFNVGCAYSTAKTHTEAQNKDKATQDKHH